jgi:NAD(P)-dependent dehydrogenase (short-subunit alcohol dehydrogenase family)
MQRRSSPLAGVAGYTEVCHDLTHFDDTAPKLAQLLNATTQLDRVILNAGVSSDLRDLVDTPLADIQHTMNVNTWSNKVLLDALLSSQLPIRQVVGISSGAAVNGSRGWNGYALSKAAFVMLLKLYAAEWPDTHFCSLAPGLVQTRMQDDLCDLEPAQLEKFSSVKRLLAARGTDDMPTPEHAAARFLRALDAVLNEPTGSFVDIRQMASV